MKKTVMLIFIIFLMGSIVISTNAIAQKKEGKAKAGMAKVTEPPVGTARTADEFSKEADYIAHPDRKHAPSLEYDFYDMHAGKKKRLPITVGQDMEQRMKQMD